MTTQLDPLQREWLHWDHLLKVARLQMRHAAAQVVRVKEEIMDLLEEGHTTPSDFSLDEGHTAPESDGAPQGASVIGNEALLKYGTLTETPWPVVPALPAGPSS